MKRYLVAFLCVFALSSTSFADERVHRIKKEGACLSHPLAEQAADQVETSLPNCQSRGFQYGTPPKGGDRRSPTFTCNDPVAKAQAIQTLAGKLGLAGKLCLDLWCWSGSCGPDSLYSAPDSYWKLRLVKDCGEDINEPERFHEESAGLDDTEECQCYYELYLHSQEHRAEPPILQAGSCSCN